ncbi:MAG: 16S rRNA (guanine(527)-N(7))-methyltransferase RsmG [Treponema sp.]|jgi:16S rRNA (guanine527-N7)-methyltransferase|nr:16S rRNA (guanine(527)-N(7))-methyltransferase RsmG [Treponema sp.]
MDATLAAGLEQLREDPRVNALLAPRIDAVAALLERYMAEIEFFNPAYGLVSVKNRRDLVIRHILDSLAALGCLPEGDRAIADVGSGAGLPGIPLAICLPGSRFTLIERMGRRAGFLRNTAAVLGLSVEVEEREMEKAAPGRFDLLVFRAFRPLEPPVLKGLLRLLAEGGTLAAWKGRRAALEEELGKLEAAGFLHSGEFRRQILPVKVPFLEEERHLVLISPSVPPAPAPLISTS